MYIGIRNNYYHTYALCDTSYFSTSRLHNMLPGEKHICKKKVLKIPSREFLINYRFNIFRQSETTLRTVLLNVIHCFRIRSNNKTLKFCQSSSLTFDILNTRRAVPFYFKIIITPVPVDRGGEEDT